MTSAKLADPLGGVGGALSHLALVAGVVVLLVVVGFFLFGLWRRWYSGGGPPVGGLTAMTGGWGTGKTLCLVAEAFQGFADPLCLGVYSTFHMHHLDGIAGGDKWHWLDPSRLLQELAELKVADDDCSAGRYVVVLLDELPVLMPSRLWEQLPPVLLFMWSQGRKLGFKVTYSAQDIRRVDRVVREVTRIQWRCKVRRWRRQVPQVIGLTSMRAMAEDDETVATKGGRRRRAHRVKTRTVKVSPAWLASYSTWERVAPATHLHQRGQRPPRGAAAPAVDGSATPPAPRRRRRRAPVVRLTGVSDAVVAEADRLEAVAAAAAGGAENPPTG